MMSELTDLSGQSFRAKLVGIGVGLEGEPCLLLDLVGREQGFRLPFSLVKDPAQIRVEDELQVSFPHGIAEKVTVRVLKGGR